MSEERIVVVTGASGAIGGAAARALVARGARVILAGREGAALAGLAGELGDRVETEPLDLGSRGSVAAASASIASRHPRIHGLVNVAAVYRSRRQERDGLEEMFAVNHLGPFRLTTALLPALRGGGRVITVTAPSTSKLDWDDLQGQRSFGALSAFGRSKMANLLFAFELARREPTVRSVAFHPGLVRSRLLAESPILGTLARWFSGSPDRAGAALAELVLGPEMATGALLHLDKPIAAAAFATDPENCRRLWEISEGLA